MQALEPDQLLERFAAKKANKVGANKDFVDMKGQKGQVELGKTAKNQNEIIGFKCTHYSVTESSGTVEICIVKKEINPVTVGVRTIDGTAKAPKCYTSFNEIITMGQGETEKIIKIGIIDNNDWQPDLDFEIELYDVNQPDEKTTQRLSGDDTKCTVTILDEDNPGKISFLKTEVTARRSEKSVDVIIQRLEGSDGKVSCLVSTEQLMEGKLSNAANEFDDYFPFNSRIIFGPGETEKAVTIKLIPKSKKTKNFDGIINKTADEEDE